MEEIFSRRPANDEFSEFYASYIERVPPGNVLHFLSMQQSTAAHLIGGVPESNAAYRYAADKWSIKEVVGHLCDTERLFSYRAMRFARDDRTSLAGMEQDPYVEAAHFDERTLHDLKQELYHSRTANILLFRSFGVAELDRGGTASGWHVTVRALLFIIAGHQEHHLQVLRERYLPHMQSDTRD